MESTDRIWTIGEVAAYLRLNPQTVYRLTQQGQLPGFKVGRHWRFSQQHIENWMRQQIERGAGAGQRDGGQDT